MPIDELEDDFILTKEWHGFKKGSGIRRDIEPWFEETYNVDVDIVGDITEGSFLDNEDIYWLHIGTSEDDPTCFIDNYEEEEEEEIER